MSTPRKKVSATELRETIRDMVRSELREAAKAGKPASASANSPSASSPSSSSGDETNPIFTGMRPADRKAMVQWIMRYYFSPKKKDQPWWSNKVKPENVLAFISNPKSNFPLTPREVADDWRIKKSLKADLAKVTDQDITSFEKNEPETAAYGSGDKSLKDIGTALGGLSAPMIQNIERAGLDKLRKILGGKNPLSMDEDELDELLKNVEETRRAVAVEFANELKGAGGDIKKFIAGLVKRNVLTPNDVQLMQPREVEMLVYLMDKPADQVAEYLRGDAKKTENKIKSFQSAVARKLSPVGQRGRPRKNPPA